MYIYEAMGGFFTKLTFCATMTYTRLVISFLLALTFQFLIGCSLTEKKLKSGWWKYGEGYHLGDVINFNRSFSLSGDTILHNGQRVGLITRKTTRWFGDDDEIEITSLDKKQSGVYHLK